MIGIHLFGEVFWFDFQHTLESQEMLLCRLKKEAMKRSLHSYLNDLLNKRVENLVKWQAGMALEQHNEEMYFKSVEYLFFKYGFKRFQLFGSEVFNEQFRRKLDGEEDLGQRIAYPL